MSGRVGRALLAMVFAGLVAQAAAAPATAGAPAVAGPSVSASGAADGTTPGWIIHADAPAGWTADCCTYARAIGVNFVLYQGEWSGEPNRVMVLNVWPRKLPTLDAELQADRKHYLARDPAAKVGSFPFRHRSMQCGANVFEGTDHIDDVVVFCDPGRASGIRLSWSMSFADNDPTRGPLLDAFMRVVVSARYEQARDAGHAASPQEAAWQRAASVGLTTSPASSILRLTDSRFPNLDPRLP
jgi:hypothetical protein